MNYKPFIATNTIRARRIMLGIRQQDVADIFEFSSTDRISHWEKGRAIPSLPNLFLLCALYHATPLELYPEFFKEAKNEIQTRVLNRKISQSTE
jgi:transcriptional regulator with XRE-family HTH domain